MAKEYTYNGEEYYPGATYQFKDKDGNIVESKGDNGYVWQAMTQGIPIYKIDKGEWYTEPYLETTQNGFVAHVPSWFRDTQEYDTWKNVYVPQIATMPINSDTIKSLQDIFKSLGSQGATRNALRTDVSRFGVTSRKLQDEYVDNIVKIVSEGKTKEKAKLNGIFGSDADESVADVARSYKNKSKEDLSRAITKLSIMSTAASRSGWTGSEEEQKQVADSITLLKLLNWVDDNPTQYGDGKEFEGLLQASFLQKFKRGFATASATFTESNVLGIPARVAYGVSNVAQGNGFDMQIENSVNYTLSTDPELGANLEGLEGAEAIGMWGGALTNIAASVATMKLAGNLLNAKMADSSAATFLNNMNNSGVVGKIAYDFFLNDLPLDTVMFINDIARNNGDVGTALWDPANPQPLTGVPFIRKDADSGFWMPSGLGPDVPGGLVMNIIGDLIVDCAPWMIKTANNSVTKYMDGISNGGFTRFRENVSLKNLAGQEAFTKIPVIGKAWTKFVDHVIGPEKAEAIREGRRAAIAQHSLDPYIIAQNLATLKNHNGMTTVAPLLKMDDERLGISRIKNDFIKNGEKYGGFGETRVDWKTVDGNKIDSNYKAVPDALPRQVKQGLLDVERLAELKGEELKDTGIIPDAARAKEIADIEKRLETTPKEIIEFAQKFSDLNKALEQIAVKLGIKTQEWVDAYAADPRFASYMTRQSLVPGYSQEMIKRDPANAAILNKSRKGYYADNYIDPTLAFSMKAEALGRAYAWNEQAKAIASFQVAQNKLIAGKGGMETAQKLEEVRNQIKNNKEFRDAVKYDTILSTMSNEAQVIGSAFREINDLMHLPESISLRSIYNAMQNPRIKTFLDDFNQGKIKFADGAIDAAGLTDSDAAFIVKNTYAYQGNKITKAKGKGGKAAKNNPDVIAKDTTPDIKYTAGVSPEGVPYRYEVIDGEIQNFERLEDTQSITDSINTLGGSLYRINFNDVEKFGNANAFALNRTILFYRDNMPNIPLPVDFKIMRNEKPGVLGWIEKPGIWAVDIYGLKIENGEVVATKFPTHMAEDWYAKGKEAKLREANEDMIRERAAPKNAVGAEYTPIHETGHMLMTRLAILELNRKIKAGEVELPKSPEMAGDLFEKEFDRIHKEMAERALAKLGYKFSESEWQRQANTITTYAGSDAYHYETFSEAISDYAFNGADAQKFSIAIVEEMKQLSERYTTAATPLEVLKGNNLEVPKGLFTKEGSYSFTSKQKTDKQKAKWLDEWRQKNPYMGGKGIMTEDQYIKANLWDTFFQKEIRAFDSKAKSATPDKLIEKNNAFLDDLRDNAAKKMVAKIREASNSKFDEELATMALSRNGQDVADAMNDFIVKRINQAAHELAENMEGGATEANLMTARATIWGDITVVESFSRMVAELTPDLSVKDVQESVGNIFKEQAEGFASVDRLPVDLKELGAEERRLREKLFEENKHSIAVGKAKEKALRGQGFIDDATQTIHYKQGGEDVYVVVSDPVVANILKKPSDFKSTGVTVEALAQLSNFIARTYRLGTTGMSPLALLRNLLRDPIQATITAGFNPLTMNLSPEAFYKSLRQYGLDDKTIADVQNRIRVWAGSSGLTAEMKNMGVVNVNSLTYRNKVEKLIKGLDNPKNKAGKVVLKIVETGEAPLEAWETMFRNQIGQQAFIKNFRRTQDVNKALSAAFFDTSNATTNFSHSVGLFKRATGTVPYLSSAINGTRSFWVLFNKDPIGMITRITAGVVVPVMAITAWNLSDEDRRKKYMSLPEWFRQSHLVILDMDGGAFAFPLPEEVQQYFGTARKYIEFTQDASPYSLPQILTQGVFGMLPGDFDGFFGPDGQIDWGKGLMQLGSGLMPQAFTTLYEFIAEHDMFTGQDLSNYNGLNKTINTLSNIFGTGIKQVANDIGTLCGASKKDLIGLSTAETLARDLFGIGLDDAKNQFMEIVGSPKKYDAEKDKITNPTGLFKENEELKAQVKALDTQIATSDEDKKDELVKLRDEKIQAFTDKVSNLINKYMQLYSISGGLEEWKKERVVQLLTLGDAWTTAPDGSYQSVDSSQAYLNERAQAQQRYLDAGLPGGPSLDALADNGSIDLQAAINRFYGVTKQATQDYKNAIKELDVKKTRDEFYDVIQRIYDDADAKGVNPDYDLIERIQARYLQQIDAVLVPIITKYGIGVLNNNDFIDAVRRQVNGMIPSDDWRQSSKNAKKFLSTKEFPTAGVDVKKWLKQRYTSAMKDRGLESDPEVVRQLQSIRKDINDGNRGAAQSKITSLMNGVAQANYYISAKDFQTLTDYSKMVK